MLLLLLLAGAVPAHAQVTAGPMPSIAELARRSAVVVLGEVVTVQSAWNATRTVIVTRVDVRVDEVLKGTVTGGRVSVHQIGGRVGDLASVVAGTPEFTAGERVLLFLSAAADGELRVAGLFQGKFSIERDPASGLEVAVRRVPGAAQPLTEMPLARVKQRIRSASGD